MREVLRQVEEHAVNNTGEKLLIVGHTDKVGPPEYNQSLSERRARSVFAFLTAKSDLDTSVAEWNLLRQTATGGLPQIKDSWGTHQYQYMLQDLGLYPGNVDGDHGDLTNDAVRSFRQAKGLPPGTTVDDAVWEALIRAYLSQDPFEIPEDRFLPNAKDGCDGGILKWLGCGEEQPLPLPKPSTEKPHRPYRRTEMLFAHADRLPCDAPQPDTFNLPAPGAVAPAWCLGPGNKSNHCCFATRNCDAAGPNQWCITTAEPGSFIVSGSIEFEDGTPAAGVKYVLIAPDGEFMDGEVVSGSRKGEGISGKTKDNGTFEYPDNPKGIGTYTMEVEGPFIARVKGEPPTAAEGNVVCKRLDGSSPFKVVLRPFSKAGPTVNPIITLASSVVVVKKSYTNPARQLVTLTSDGPFFRSGTVTRVGTAIRFFDAVVNGTEITFNGTDNVFTGSQLSAGVQLFTDSLTPSVALDDVELTLTLTPGATPIGPPAIATMTAVELTLDVALSRVAAGVDPPLMPQPPAVVPVPPTDKVNLGRFVQVQDPSFSHERAMLIVQQTNPATFAGTLLLTPINAAQLQVFTDEVPARGQTPVTPIPFPIAGPIPPGGTRLFVEALGVSAAARDNGFQLGIQNVEVEADRVAITTTQLATIDTAAAAAPPLRFVRFGLWDLAHVGANGDPQNAVPEATNFVGADRRRFHFRVKTPIAGTSVNVDWKTLRANRVTDEDAPAPRTAADSPLVITLPQVAAGATDFISRGLTLVTDDVDRAFDTNSGLLAPLDAGLRRIGESNHRSRRAKIDSFNHVQFQPAAGQTHRLLLPVFDREAPFTVTSTTNVAVGSQVVTPSAMSGTTPTGSRFSITVGATLTIDTGANQEDVVVTAVTAATFTATFTRAHNGAAAAFQIAGRADERLRVNMRVIRYLKPTVAAYIPSRDPQDIQPQFDEAIVRWCQSAVQIDRQATEDREIPAAALTAGKVTVANILGAQGQALFNDLLSIAPAIPNNTLTVVFLDLVGANALTTILDFDSVFGPLPAGTLGDRIFILMASRLDPRDITLAHELHHALYNRGHLGLVIDNRFFTFNTSPPTVLAAPLGIVLPDVRIYHRMHTLHNGNDPNLDPNNDNTLNWVRRTRTGGRFPVVNDLTPATATAGNTLVTGF